MITIYHNPDCSKSRESLALLASNDTNFVIKEYLKEEITKEELESILIMLGLKPLDLIRKNERIFIDNFQHLDLGNEEWIELMIQHPILIERPIVVKNGKAAIGRPIAKIISLLTD